MPDPLEPSTYRTIVRAALLEDIGPGDITTAATVPADSRAEAVIVAKSACVLAGLDVAREAFLQVDPAVTFAAIKHDGDSCAAGSRVATVQGPAAAILTAERTALNFLQRLSGVATRTREFVEATGGRLTILDTRKTTPTLRVLEKYAVRCGGGANHRTGLYDGVLIKENHARVAGGIGSAVQRVRERGASPPIEVEAQSLQDVEAALAAGAEIIMLDNLDDVATQAALSTIAGRARVELSGNMTLERVRRLAQTGADCISIGALTHSAPAADLSLEVERLLSLA